MNSDTKSKLLAWTKGAAKFYIQTADEDKDREHVLSVEQHVSHYLDTFLKGNPKFKLSDSNSLILAISSIVMKVLGVENFDEEKFVDKLIKKPSDIVVVKALQVKIALMMIEQLQMGLPLMEAERRVRPKPKVEKKEPVRPEKKLEVVKPEKKPEAVKSEIPSKQEASATSLTKADLSALLKQSMRIWPVLLADQAVEPHEVDLLSRIYRTFVGSLYTCKSQSEAQSAVVAVYIFVLANLGILEVTPDLLSTIESRSKGQLPLRKMQDVNTMITSMEHEETLIAKIDQFIEDWGAEDEGDVEEEVGVED